MTRIAITTADTPLGERFVSGLGYPLRGGALATCIALAISHVIVILPYGLGMAASLALWAYTWRYAALCLMHTANGFADPPNVGAQESTSTGVALTAIHLFAVAMCMLAAVLHPPLMWPLIVLFAVALPAIDMSMAFDGNAELAMSPRSWWDIISRLGLTYLLPVTINVITAALVVLTSFITGMLPKLLALPLFAFAQTYLVVFNLHLMGAMIHRRHEQFGIEPEAEILARANGQDADSDLLQQVETLGATDPRAAMRLLAPRLQDRIAPAALHLAYRQLLRRENLRDGLLVHGQIWIAALLANGETRRALGLAQECMEIDPAFIPDDPGTAGPLADFAARNGMEQIALRLCRGFIAHWPRSPDTAHYGLLAARLLARQPERRAEAGVLLAKLLSAWPGHPLHAELAALARQLQEQPSHP